MITLQEFIEKTQNKWIVRTALPNGTYRTTYLDSKNPNAQCMTLVNAAMEIFGYDITQRSPLGANTAYESFQNGHPDFLKIETSDVQQFVEGDIAYLAPTPTNSAGHVFIVHQIIGEGIEGYDQNYPIGSPCHIQWHTDKNIIGVLRHKSIVMTLKEIEDQLITINQQLVKVNDDIIKLKANKYGKKRVLQTIEDRLKKIL